MQVLIDTDNSVEHLSFTRDVAADLEDGFMRYEPQLTRVEVQMRTVISKESWPNIPLWKRAAPG